MRDMWTLEDFGRKADYEGGWEGMWYWGGDRVFTDDPTLNILFRNFGTALQELQEYWDSLDVDTTDDDE